MIYSDLSGDNRIVNRVGGEGTRPSGNGVSFSPFYRERPSTATSTFGFLTGWERPAALSARHHLTVLPPKRRGPRAEGGVI